MSEARLQQTNNAIIMLEQIECPAVFFHNNVFQLFKKRSFVFKMHTTDVPRLFNLFCPQAVNWFSSRELLIFLVEFRHISFLIGVCA